MVVVVLVNTHAEQVAAREGVVHHVVLEQEEGQVSTANVEVEEEEEATPEDNDAPTV